MVISRTPVRISLFGGGTDYPIYYLRKKGAVLGTTIDKYTYISVNTPEKNFFEYSMRISYSKTELVKEIDQIEHPSVRETLKFKNFSKNLDLHIFSDLPAKTGLGSSSSFTVGLLNVLYALDGKLISKQRLAEEACFIEQQLIKENVGSQDQFHASFGGLNIMEFGSTIKVRPLVISSKKIKLLEDSLLIFYTGLTRFASEIVKEQIENTQKLSNDLYLEKMYEMVFQAEQIICESEENSMVQKLGYLLDESWNLKKKLSSKISNPFIDKIYEKAKKEGAFGGKLCGAGSGGFLALLVNEKNKERIRALLKDLPEVNFSFDHSGSSIIYMKE